METKKIKIHAIPAIIWGSTSSRVYLYIHGQSGCKEEAETFAQIACHYSCQVLSIDLPAHGERTDEKNNFDPWHIVPELISVMEYAKSHWTQVSLFANSLGVWFSMLSFENEKIERSLFVSPVLDMKQLISKMMIWANVSELQLERELIIPTSFGQTLSWEYLSYAKRHPITKWNIPTKILYGEHDELIDYDVVEKFAQQFGCDLTVMKNGEHWFHTQEQLGILSDWVRNSLNVQGFNTKSQQTLAAVDSNFGES
jgi:pimeloyl-ACP methyl ester carboxylesterase